MKCFLSEKTKLTKIYKKQLANIIAAGEKLEEGEDEENK